MRFVAELLSINHIYCLTALKYIFVVIWELGVRKVYSTGIGIKVLFMEVYV